MTDRTADTSHPTSTRRDASAATATATATVASSANMPSPVVAQSSADAAARPLSFAQERLWLAQEIEPESYRYNEVTVHRVTGDLRPRVLAQAVVRLAERHEVLRTTYALGDEGLRQVALPADALALAVVDLSALGRSAAPAALRAELARMRRKPFRLDRDVPVRATLFQTSRGESFFAVAVHHIACDRVSAAIFIGELCAVYDALARGAEAQLPPLRAQYADFAAWERSHFTDERLEREAAYWGDLLAGASAPELPFRKRSNERGALDAAAHTLTLDAPLVKTLAAFARKSGTTVPNVLLAALSSLVARYTAQRKIAVALPLAARHRPEVEKLIGLFVNTVVLGIDVPAEATFAQIVKHVSRRAFEVYARGGVPFNSVAERRGIAVEPLLEMAWTYLGGGLGATETAGALRFEPTTNLLADKAVFPLEFLVVESGGQIELRMVYARELFEPEASARFLSNYENLLRSATAAPTLKLSELELIGDAERAQLLKQGTGARATHAAADFLELFRTAVAQTPDAPAVSSEQVVATYAELDAASERIARVIREQKLAAEDVVAVVSERVPEVLSCLLACLKTNTSYLPISRAYPRERVREILRDACVKLTLTFRAFAEDASTHDAPIVCLDELDANTRGAVSTEPTDTAVALESCAGNLAYIIYTSGSTGRPKGVLVERGGMLNHLLAKVCVLELTAADVVAFNAPVSFDISIWQMLAPLAAAASVRFVSEAAAADPARLCEDLIAGGVTIFETVPSMLGAMLDAPECARLNDSKLRWVISNAEALPPGMCRRFEEKFPAIRLLNAYGPTECSDDVTHFEIKPTAAAADFEIVPIGSPVANTQLYVLDGAGRLCPSGVLGELYIGGTGVARGYVNRPELTAEKFVPDPFGGHAGARLYRTGDVVRWREDRQLEFLGRQDQQVKLRGYRIELGEIESALSTHAGVGQCAVMVLEIAGAQTLVAYIAGDADAAGLREHAARQLPSYMVPQRVVKLDALPLTTNGKIDRKALPAPDAAEETATSYLAPRTACEEIVCNVWAEVLGRARVGVDEDFFALGGHSLLATQVISRVRAVFGVEVPLRVMFETPTPEALAAEVERLKKKRDGAATLATELVRADRGDRVPLSFAQQRLWFIDQLEPGNAAYNVPFAVRLTGTLNVAALTDSLSEIVRRHEVLRTSFPTVDAAPVQLIHEAQPVPVPVMDVAHLSLTEREQAAQKLATAEAGKPFDLAAGSLLRALLVRLSEQEHVLVVVLHHIVSDGWSTGVLVREFSQLYEAYQAGQPSPLAELPIQYADYAVWQREWLTGDVLDSQLAYWREQLKDLERLELPTDGAHATASAAGAVVRFEVGAELTEGLRELSRREGVTLFMVLTGALQLLLSKYTGQTDVAVGTAVANRGRVEIEPLVGFFVNTLVLRTDLSGAPSFAELLGRVRETVLGAYAHQELPFEKLVDEVAPRRDLSRSPLFQVMLVMQNLSAAEMRLDGLAIEPLEVSHGGAKFDLMLTLDERAGSIVADLEFRTELFSRAAVERLRDHFLRVLETCAADARRNIAAFELTPETERARLLEMSQPTRRAFDVECVHESFRRQAMRTPHAVALEDDERTRTYAELDQDSDRVARALRRAGIGRGTLVGVCLERGVELVAVLLGVLKAGAAYVPLDPEYPAERLDYMIGDACVAAVVTDPALSVSALTTCPAPKLIAGELLSQCDAAVEEVLPRVSNDELAYVIYTSGSTGRPKGVAVSHAALSNHMSWFCETFDVGAGDRVLQKTVVSFDASVWEFYAPLLVGGTLLLAGAGAHRDPAALVENIRRGRATILQVVPTMLSFLVKQDGWRDCETLRLVCCGGEALAETLRQKFSETTRAELVNLYGPTEATIDATYWRSADGAPLGIGRPIANATAYVLDAWGGLCPVGIAGELYIGGAGVARGYVNRPELTAEKFIPDPFSTVGGARLYRTGDMVRWRADGQLEFLGRQDAQVKLRGYRIELGEIESVIARHIGVRQCAAVIREHGGSDTLVAYVAGDTEVGELREHLTRHLPSYMVPQRIVRLDALPLTTNGKVNRQALPAPDALSAAENGTTGYAAPRTAVEALLCRVWAEVLGRERVGIHDNFFELGGDSILSIQIGARAAQHGLTLTTRELFEHQTIAALGEAAGLELAGEGSTRGMSGGDEVALTPIQRWFFSQGWRREWHYNQAALLADAATVDGRLMQAAVEQVLAAHEVFDLRYDRTESGEVRQRYAGRTVESEGSAESESTRPRRCGRADLRSLPRAAQGKVIEQVAARVQASLNLESGCLVAALRFEVTGEVDSDTGEGGAVGGRLLVVAHHLVIDGVSWRILLDQVERVYQDVQAGKESVLRGQGSSFGQWAQALMQEAGSDETQGELAYWLTQQPRRDERLPRDYKAGANTVASSESIAVEFDAEQTDILLREVPRRLRAQVEEVLVLGVVEALREWGGNQSVVVECEGHGREPVAGVDVTQTVGWFTTLYPVRFTKTTEGDMTCDSRSATSDNGGVTITERLREVRDQLRGVPRKGLGYGLLKYVGQAEALAGVNAEVSFNYLGQWDANLGGLFHGAQESAGESQWEGEERSHLIEVHGSVSGARLRMVWTYSRNLHKAETMERVAALFRRTVEQVVAACVGECDAGLCLEDESAEAESSDFSLSDAELSDLLAEVGARE
ncbi:MAG: hypothetical protein QOD32_1241 [Pyrinomonadaceae bacterium]|nr:hypothetical protein [Pyrinomonadaceae bacterium]